jgi:predicted O-linked N-acetylglucosamine transferase (SPINDLY family)
MQGEVSAILLQLNTALARDDLIAAAKLVTRLLALQPDNLQIARAYVQIHANLSARQIRTGDFSAAKASAKLALARGENALIARYNLVTALEGLADFDRALVALDELTARTPDDADLPNRREQLLIAGAKYFADSGDGESARVWQQRRPGAKAFIAAKLTLPTVYSSALHVHQEREWYGARLSELTAIPADEFIRRFQPSLEDLSWSPFLLAYQCEDDRASNAQYGDWLCAVLRAGWPDLAGAKPAVRGRIGLLSSHFRECTVGAYFGSWISILRKAGFEVEVYQLGPQHDAWTTKLIAIGTRGAVLHGSLAEQASALRERQFDLLIFPELGMDGRVMVLAALRLAHLQACAWGHPVTSGLPTVEHYFSVAAMEPNNAALHYTETLHCLPGLGTHYAAPLRPPMLTKSELALPAAPLVLVPQSVFKLLPQNDARLIALAQRCPAAEFVLFDGESRAMTMALQTRMQQAFVAHDLDPKRLHWLPLRSRENYLQVNAICDLKLSSYGWSGGNTSLDALHMGVPIVTCSGEFMRGRQSAGMLQRLGLPQLVAADQRGLVEMAVRVLDNPDLRRELTAQIFNGLPDLLVAPGVSKALVDTVQGLLA